MQLENETVGAAQHRALVQSLRQLTAWIDVKTMAYQLTERLLD